MANDVLKPEVLARARKSMLSINGVMPFRWGIYHFIYAFALVSVILLVWGLVFKAGGLLWMLAGAWAILISQFCWMVLMDPPASAKAGKRKLYCVVSREALDKMTVKKEGQADTFLRGKFAAQCGHAYLHAWWDAFVRFNADAIAYRSSQHAFKIAVVVDSDAQLVALEDTYRDRCGVSLVTDAGFTVFNGQPTITCLGIGPIHEDDIGQDLKDLKLLR